MLTVPLSAIRLEWWQNDSSRNMVLIMMRLSVQWLCPPPLDCCSLWLSHDGGTFVSLIFRMPFLMAILMSRYICDNLLVLLTHLNLTTTVIWFGLFMVSNRLPGCGMLVSVLCLALQDLNHLLLTHHYSFFNVLMSLFFRCFMLMTLLFLARLSLCIFC
jgi:hypothetical protein